jgi:hypothetical protein
MSVPRDERIDSFIEAFKTLGYEICENGLEVGFEKIAIYSLNGQPTHAARQLENGNWTSKLGRLEDIEHYSTRAVEDFKYGRVVVFMKRRVSR